MNTQTRKWGFNVKQQFEDYITRSRAIRSLSMPPEEPEAHIGEIYRLFNENFGKIKVLLAENKKILDQSVFRPLKNPDTLTAEQLAEFKNFADMLADLRCNAGRMFNPDLVQLFDSEQLQQQIEALITIDWEQLYREVFGKNVTLVL